MQDFYKEVDNNININRTFSINDIGDEDRLHRFYILGENVEINNILEDSEFLLEATEKVIGKLDQAVSNATGVANCECKEGDDNSSLESGAENIVLEPEPIVSDESEN
jgi:hypothetical protein